jgi:hypothetical protein
MDARDLPAPTNVMGTGAGIRDSPTARRLIWEGTRTREPGRRNAR